MICAGLTDSQIGQALRLAVEQGLHTDMQSLQLPEKLFERCKETWWTVYILDRRMTSLMGVPMSISEDDITAPYPAFGGSSCKQHALGIHIKLAQANAAIIQSQSSIVCVEADADLNHSCVRESWRQSTSIPSQYERRAQDNSGSE